MKQFVVSVLTKREIHKKKEDIDIVKEKTNVLYNGELLPEEVKKESPVFYELYDLAERIFPTTGLLLTFLCTSLASMCTSEKRQFNLLIGKETGEGGTLIVSQLSRIPFVRAIYDSHTATDFVLKYCGLYVTRLGSKIPDGVTVIGKKGSYTIEKSGAVPIDKQFFISKGMDKLFHQHSSVLERTLTFQNPLFEEGYAGYGDDHAGHYEIGAKDNPLKIGFMGICTLDDLNDTALKTSGWIERIITGSWFSHPKEDKIIIQGITRQKLPEVDLSHHISELMAHLNPNYPIKINPWNEEVSSALERFALFCKESRREKKGKRAARDATRIIQALPALDKRYNVCASDMAKMEALAMTMRTNPLLGWRVPFQYAIRRYYQTEEEIVKSIYSLFRNWDGSPLYTEDDIQQTIRLCKGGSF